MFGDGFDVENNTNSFVLLLLYRIILYYKGFSLSLCRKTGAGTNKLLTDCKVLTDCKIALFCLYSC